MFKQLRTDLAKAHGLKVIEKYLTEREII